MGKATVSWARRLQRWLLTGLILTAPAFVTFLALSWLFGHVDRPLRTLLAQTTGYDVPGVGVVSILLLLIGTGAIASSFLVRGLIRWVERSLDRIPFVRTLYSGVKQLVAPLADEHGASFQRVVIVPFPASDSYAIGFLIKPGAGVGADGEPLHAVLVPTNHLHLGNVVLYPASRVLDVNLTAEEALRFLVSMGAGLAHPLQPGSPAVAGQAGAELPATVGATLKLPPGP